MLGLLERGNIEVTFEVTYETFVTIRTKDNAFFALLASIRLVMLTDPYR